MTPEQIEYRYLSLRSWLQRVVAPSAGLLLFALLICFGMADETLRDQTALLIAFAALYYILIRGGHIIMIRSLHMDMLKRYEAEYRERIAALTPQHLRRNIGFTLTRVKRDILDSVK